MPGVARPTSREGRVDPTSTPWRALEETGRQPAGVEDRPPPPPARYQPSTVLAAVGAVLLAVVAVVLAFGTGQGGSVVVDSTTPLGLGASSSDGAAVPGDGLIDRAASTLVVEVVGAVDNPGVYRLPSGSRVGDLLEAAGGYGPRVDTDRAGHDLNLAAPLHDGDQVRVPSRDDPTAAPAAPAAGSGGRGGSPGPVDLNQATASDLDTLPGIGPVTAAKIIASREEQPFRSVEDLRTRKLVGEKTFANLKGLVAVH